MKIKRLFTAACMTAFAFITSGLQGKSIRHKKTVKAKQNTAKTVKTNKTVSKSTVIKNTNILQGGGARRDDLCDDAARPCRRFAARRNACRFCQSSTLLKEMSQEQISEVFATKKNDTLYVTNFFATWCRPCMDEMPHFQEKIKEMKNEKVKFTFINLDEPQNWTKVADFAEKSGLGNNIILFNFGNASKDFFSKNFET